MKDAIKGILVGLAIYIIVFPLSVLIGMNISRFFEGEYEKKDDE